MMNSVKYKKKLSIPICEQVYYDPVKPMELNRKWLSYPKLSINMQIKQW